MSVHKAITKHVESQNSRINLFHQLESQREHFISDAVAKCEQGEPFSVDAINDVTAKINELATQGVVPTRKVVTVEMVKEYVQKRTQA